MTASDQNNESISDKGQPLVQVSALEAGQGTPTAAEGNHVGHGAHEDDGLEPVRLLLVPMTCIFQGYAAYVVLQRFLKSELNASSDQARKDAFTASTTLMHWGKLVSRVGHDLFFVCLPTRVRVAVAMVLVLLAVLIPPIFVFGGGSTWMGWAFLHFGLLGVGVGVFEGTFLSVISPLGRLTKAWAIMGTPLGLAIVDIVCQLLHSKAVMGDSAVQPEYFYWYIAVCIPPAIVIFWKYAPSEGAAHPQAHIIASLMDWRRWLIPMVPFFLAKIIGSFVMENTPGWFYVYDGKKVPMFSPSGTTSLMDPDLYFVIIYISVLLGDGISRRIVYLFRLDTARANVAMLSVAILCSAGGFFLESFAVATVTILAAFLAFWGNGLGYAVAAKYIDSFVPREHSRAVYSLWCMIGDVGGVMGAAVVLWVDDVYCKGRHYTYECL